MTLGEFEEMTPFEFKTIVEVKQEQQKAKAEEDLLKAYMMAYFQRVNKLEPFETYRKKLDGAENEKKTMSNEDMLAKIIQLNEMMNGNKANHERG